MGLVRSISNFNTTYVFSRNMTVVHQVYYYILLFYSCTNNSPVINFSNIASLEVVIEVLSMIYNFFLRLCTL